MLFIETPIFTDDVRDLLSSEEYRHLQIALLLRPDQGAVIPGSGGLRKIRWGAGTRGKSGGVRVIYYWDRKPEVIYLLLIYAKSERNDLTKAQLKVLRKLIKGQLEDE